jgi:peptide/nickel transport system ATP-binding protein/oligopeptide transport system ATP-binding protein
MSGTTDTRSILSVQDLRIHFSTGRRHEYVRAVDGVSFAVCAGETFGVIGESGSGKSTLARAMVCLTRPTSGRILHRGVDLFALPAGALRRQFQMVFQDSSAALDPRMSVGASIREPLELAAEGMPAEWDRRVQELLDCVGLRGSTTESYPHELSGGQKQRVNIARALALQPALIVCDEVVAALDASIQADILNLFSDLQARFKLTYVFITHDLGVVSHVSDRIAVMYLGRVMELGPTVALTEAPLHPYTQALLAAEPVPLPRALRPIKRAPLQGEVPSPISPPSGCGFRTRCPLADARCAAEVPPLRHLANGRSVACHYAAADDAFRTVNAVPTASTIAASTG